MRRRSLGRWVVGWSVLIGLAGSAARSSGADIPWAETLFAERQHDFGPVPRGAKVRHPFVLTNRTSNPISILNLRVSCGCTSGKASVSVVPPGGTGVVEAEMDTRNFVGRKATTLYVTVHNGFGESEVALNVASTILSDIVLNPGGVDFGAIVRGQSPTLSLTIDRVAKPGWKIVRMVSTSKVLTASLTEVARTSEMISYRLDVSIKPDTPSGLVRDEIQFITNDGESRGFPVLVTGQVRGELSVTPTVLALPAPTSAEPVKGRFVVRSGRPFKVMGVEGTGEGYETAIDSPDARPVHVVTISYRPDAKAPASTAGRTFKIVTDIPGEAPAVVTSTLQGAP